MKPQWILYSPLILLRGSAAMHKYVQEAMEGRRVSGFSLSTADAWEPKFNDESPPFEACRIGRANWVAVCSSSQASHDCKHAIDGDYRTSWLSKDQPGEHSITVDMKDSHTVTAVVINPPINSEAGLQQTTVVEGLIKKHKIYLSNDNHSWIGPVAYGMWPDTNRQRMSAFEPVAARYVKVLATSSTWIGVGNLNIYGSTKSPASISGNGAWGPTIDFPVVPVAGAQEASGHITLWSSWASDQFHSTPGGKTVMARLSPSAHEVSQRLIHNTAHDMFCPGISVDGTGAIVVTGGNDAAQTSVYISDEDRWVRKKEMKLRRGYQASTTLSDGRVFVIGGSWNGGSNIDKDGEVYDPIRDTWTLLPGAKVENMLTDDIEGQWRADNHGWLFGWRNGTVFQAGPSKSMNWYYTEGAGKVQGAGNRLEDDDSMSGNAVMFDAVEGKILTLGGSPYYDRDFGTNRAHIITLGDPGKLPRVELAGTNGTMNYKRVFHTSVVLPDGKVFITGGQTYGVPFNEENVQLTPEIYDPDENTFTELQSNNVIRVYHSISLLLPDGRVLNAGGGLCGKCAANHFDGQIFTPPYLLTKEGKPRERPVIIEKELNITDGGKVSFHTRDPIATASLVRMGSATHTVNTDQRRVPLRLESNERGRGWKHTVNLPDDSGVLIPGNWMLFAMNHEGVPSVSRIIVIRTNQMSMERLQKQEDNSYWMQKSRLDLIK